MISFGWEVARDPNAELIGLTLVPRSESVSCSLLNLLILMAKWVVCALRTNGSNLKFLLRY
jgi:hypothetical protein